MIGKTISHYKILEELGCGGMGIVYKAQDLKLDRFVALKFLPPHLTTSSEEKQRFIHEAKAASTIEHNNICNIHEIDETEDGQLYISMAYYEGETLNSKIKEKTPGIEEALGIAIQIAEGLRQAHEKQIIHRDIKPANIMLTNAGVVKILDFGLAKLKGQVRLTKEGITLGTIAYMSPEQTQGESIDERTDIWSLGVILYEMISGQLPFQGAYDQAILYSILNENPTNVTKLRNNLPPLLTEIINKALQKNPAERYQNINEILTDLKELKSSYETGSQQIRSAAWMGKRIFIYGSIAVLLLIIIIVLYLLTFFRGAGSDTKSIAVLPFKNLSTESGDEYFSDGITEDVIAQLAKMADLKVISRTSAMLYKNSDKNIKDIGRELNVAWILEGSVRRANNKIRIVAQLIDANKDEHLWVDTYDEEFDQIFAIQSDVAQKIASSLEMKISPIQKDRIEKKATDNLEAYDLYLKGRYYWNKRLPDELKKSIEYFQQAIEVDPKYALAYSGLADAYSILGNFNVLPGQETYRKAKEAAAKSLEIDSLLGEAHTSLGYAKFYADWDWGEAETEFRKGMALNPGNAVAFSWYAFFLTAMGKFDEATIVRNRAQELDPLSIVIRAEIGLEFYFERKYNLAIEQCQKTLKKDPLFQAAYIPLGGAFIQNRMYDNAITTFSKASLFSKGHPVTVAALGYTYAVSGGRDDAMMMVELLEERSADEYVSPFWMAAIYVGLNDEENAFKWLDKAYEEKDGSMVFLKVIPLFDSLRSNPRFISILKNMRLE